MFLSDRSLGIFRIDFCRIVNVGNLAGVITFGLKFEDTGFNFRPPKEHNCNKKGKQHRGHGVAVHSPVVVESNELDLEPFPNFSSR